MIFKNFADQDWIGFNFIGWGLDSDWKISQSAHLCLLEKTSHQKRWTSQWWALDWTWIGLDPDYSTFR